MLPVMIAVGGGVVLMLTGIVLFIIRKRSKSNLSAGNKVLAGDLHNEKLKSDIIINSIEDGVVLIDSALNIQTFNPGAVNLTGWQVKDAVGLDYMSVLKFVTPKGEPYPEGTDPIKQALDQGQVVRNNEVAISSISGDRSIPIFISTSPLIGEDGTVNGAVSVIRDVSKERTQESQRAEFISTASHEMRTPVAAIEGYLALALNDSVCKVDSKARDYLNKAHTSTQHLGKLFQDLLTAAKSEDGRLTNHPTVVDLGKFMAEVTDNLKFTAEKKGLLTEFILGVEHTSSGAVDATTSSGMKTIQPAYYALIDQDRMREVITNLFDNAVKYSEKGKITIALTGDKNICQIRIIDTGNGIPAEDLPHLFQKFYRVDNSSTRTVGGTGLGLFICKKIVELYNGRIWADSKFGEGSTFYINLPRIESTKALNMIAQQAPVSTMAE